VGAGAGRDYQVAAVDPGHAGAERCAGALLRPDGRTIELFNPNHAGTPKERTSYRPALRWAYHDAGGRLVGYVLGCLPGAYPDTSVPGEK